MKDCKGKLIPGYNYWVNSCDFNKDGKIDIIVGSAIRLYDGKFVAGMNESFYSNPSCVINYTKSKVSVKSRVYILFGK